MPLRGKRGLLSSNPNSVLLDILPFTDDIRHPRSKKPPHSKRLVKPTRVPKSKRCLTVTTVATADSYKFRELRRYLAPVYGSEEDSPEVLSLTFPSFGGEPETFVFFFPYGVTVWWGSDQVGRQVLAQIRQFEVLSEPQIDFETCVYSYSNPPPPITINLDHIYLEDHSLQLKIAYSLGLAQSAKLTVFEDRIEEVINQAKIYPEIMGTEGSVGLSQTQASKLKATLFLQRLNVNLRSDISETPEWFWEHSDLKRVYEETRKYMDIDQRVDVLNQRLEIVAELFEVMHEELNVKHARHLELITICLVIVEVFFGILYIWRQMAKHNIL